MEHTLEDPRLLGHVRQAPLHVGGPAHKLRTRGPSHHTREPSQGGLAVVWDGGRDGKKINTPPNSLSLLVK